MPCDDRQTGPTTPVVVYWSEPLLHYILLIFCINPLANYSLIRLVAAIDAASAFSALQKPTERYAAFHALKSQRDIPASDWKSISPLQVRDHPGVLRLVGLELRPMRRERGYRVLDRLQLQLQLRQWP